VKKRWGWVLMTGLFLVTLLSTSVWAISPEEVLARVHENWGKIEDLQATITIVTEIPGMQQPMEQEGEYYYKAPDKIRIDIIAPSEQTTVINGSTMTVKIADKINTIDLTKFPGMENINFQGISSIEKWREQYAFAITGTSEGTYTLEMKPKEENALYSKMEMDIEYEKEGVKQTRLYDKDGKLQTKMSYEEYVSIGDNVWYQTKLITQTDTPQGKAKTETTYTEIEVNQGMRDDVFKIQ